MLKFTGARGFLATKKIRIFPHNSLTISSVIVSGGILNRRSQILSAEGISAEGTVHPMDWDRWDFCIKKSVGLWRANP
jgi:hypothetical protein